VSRDFIVGEIKEGRLAAVVLVAHTRGGSRNMYRVAPAALEAYIKEFRWPQNRSV
jgi:hypothetical protein